MSFFSLTNKAVLVLALLLVWAAAGTAAQAQTVETRTVTVTSTRAERDLMEIPLSVSVTSDEDIRRAPNLTIADQLSNLPGVQVTDGSMPGSKRIMIRGESPMRSLILVDGVKISEHKCMSGAAILLDTSNIERIEVIKGPASVLYGSEAIGGVLNIITKKGGEKPVAFSLNTYLDSSVHGLELQGALFGSYNGFNYRFTGSGINAGLRRGVNGSIPLSDFQNRYYSGRVGYQWDKGEVYVKADSYKSEIHIPTNVSPGYIYYGGLALNNITSVGLYLPQWDRNTISAGLELRELTPYLEKVKFEAYFQNMKKDFYNLVNPYSWRNNMRMGPFRGNFLASPEIRTHTFNDQDSYGGSLQTDWSLGESHHLIVGADFNRDVLIADDDRLGIKTTTATPPMFIPKVTSEPGFSYRYKVTQENMSLFAQDEWEIGSGFTATLGLRQTWVSSEFNDKGGNPFFEESGKKSDSHLVGSLGLVYSGINDLSLRALWSQGYRFPPLNELYLGTVHGSTARTLGNPNLKPETSNNFEVGARYDNGALNLDLGAFYSLSKNLITTQPEGADNRFVNSDEAKTWGIEAAVNYTILDTGLTPYVTATYLNRKITDTIFAGYVRKPGETIRYSTDKVGQPQFFGRVGLKYQYDFSSNIQFYSDAYLNWATRAKRYYFDDSFVHDVNGTGNIDTFDYAFVTEEYPGWSTLNLTLGLEWGEEHRWNATFALRNILDRKYTIATNVIEEPGFHVVAGVGFEF
jgi:hemoglobin/transferrin/lactoferrin receptor protein